MEYLNNKLCISARELIDGGFMTKASYEKNVTRHKIEVAKRGGGAKGSGASVHDVSSVHVGGACGANVNDKYMRICEHFGVGPGR